MDILLIVSSYLPNRGGLQTVTSQLAKELQRRGIQVSVLTQRYPRTLAASEEIDGVPVQRLLFLTPRLRDLQRGRLDLFFASLFFFPITLMRLICRIARDKPDVINLHFLGAHPLFVLVARWLVHFRFIVTLHGDDVEGLPRGTWFDRWVFCATLRRADGVTACSRYLLDLAKTVEPTIEKKARVIYNGADLNLSSFPFPLRSKIPEVEDSRSAAEGAERRGEGGEGVRLLAAGRMVPKKGFDVLLRALKCNDGKQKMRLNLIGDGPEHSKLESLARELGLQDQVAFLGLQDHAFVVRAMQSSCMVVVPSREEPFGLVALEAMAAGKPVVATRVGGLPEVLQDADAILVEPNDPEALAAAIINMLAQLEREPEFGARNRAIAARFSIAQMTDCYEAIYSPSSPRSL